jgi:hypothetical protein
VALLRRRMLLRTNLWKSLVDAAGLPGPVPADVDEEPSSPFPSFPSATLAIAMRVEYESVKNSGKMSLD